ncbi:MAG: hypothetical protein HYZ75_07300 [Elusimicrobia bacterium]|nr:hypothetical protein [Elusimicrobiota bacterium]
MFKRTAAVLLLAAAIVHAESGSDGDVLTAHDREGNIATAFNQFDGRVHSIQVNRLTAQGYNLWTDLHADGYDEMAYAAAMDPLGGIYLAGVRKQNRQKNFLVIKYNQNGGLEWEQTDDASNCTATHLDADREGDVVAAGVCRTGGSYPARVVKYGNNGGFQWAQEYDGGGRNYIRGFSIDYTGTISVSVETVFGNYRDGSYVTRTVIYSPYGQQLEVR